MERVDVNYSRAAKQVDVRSLKELMWRGMHSTLPADAPPSPDTVLQFQVRRSGCGCVGWFQDKHGWQAGASVVQGLALVNHLLLAPGCSAPAVPGGWPGCGKCASAVSVTLLLLTGIGSMPVYLGVPAPCLPQDVLATVPEQNAAGRLEDLSGGCLLLRARRCWLLLA